MPLSLPFHYFHRKRANDARACTEVKQCLIGFLRKCFLNVMACVEALKLDFTRPLSPYAQRCQESRKRSWTYLILITYCVPEPSYCGEVSSVGRAAPALQDNGHQRYTIRYFLGADHAIRVRDAATGRLTFAPDYLDTVAAWILAC